MSMRIHKTASLLGKLAVASAGLAGGLLLAAPAGATSTPLIPPAIPGVAPLPGPVAAAAEPAANMGVLATKPDTGVAGTAMTISGANLPANKDVTITWATANVTWVVDARPDSVDYLGRKADKLAVVLATAKTDANGSFSVGLKAPKDFGGIHDIYAVVEGTQVAKGGFLIARSAKMTPRRGPIGTMITLTYTGLGSSLYEGGAALYYDNKYVGPSWPTGHAGRRLSDSGRPAPSAIT